MFLKGMISRTIFYISFAKQPLTRISNCESREKL